MNIVTRNGEFCEHDIKELFNCEYCEIKHLKTQLKEANSLIDYCLTETVMHSYDKDKLIEYKDKYKDRYE